MKKYKGDNWTLYHADCLDVCKSAPDNYFSNIIADPPYCLESIAKRFGKKGSAQAKHGTDGAFNRLSKNFHEQNWDDDIVFKASTWKEFYRVVKPGGIVLSFAADQNYHRMAYAAEKAGFKIKRIIGWLYGTGMVHGVDIEKAMSKKGKRVGKYKGYGTALKPALEPIMVAIKPLSEKTILENLEKWGTAGIYNIEKCRIPDSKKPKYPTNIIHDGSEQIASNGNFMPNYFYCAKPSKIEKDGSNHPCLIPGELVLTNKGFIEIENISIGSKVYSDDGTFRSVTDAFSKPCKGYVYKIETVGNNQSTTVTNNHPYLVWELNEGFKDTRRKKEKGNPVWKEAELLKEGDYTVTPIYKYINTRKDYNEKWWWIAGLWLAEGSSLSNGRGNAYPVFTLHKEEQEYIDIIKSEFKSVRVYDKADSNSVNVVVFEKGLIDVYKKLMGYGSKNHNINNYVFKQVELYRRNFLDGYLQGDGCVVREAFRAKTSSSRLAYDLVRFALTIGAKASWYKHSDEGVDRFIGDRKIKTDVYYSIYFPKLFNPMIASSTSIDIVEHEDVKYLISKIKKIEKYDYNGPVWNLTVEGRHTFHTLAGMSHNTVKPIALMRYLVRLVTPPGGKIFEPFAGSGTTMQAAIEEGFKVIGCEKTKKYIPEIRKRLNGAKASPKEKSQETSKESKKVKKGK